MKNSNLKSKLLVSVAVVALLGTIGWREFISPSMATEAHEHKEDGHGHGEEQTETEAHGEEAGHEEGEIHLTEEQIKAAGITVIKAGAGTLDAGVAVPGKIVTAADKMAQIVPKIGGIVTAARKNLGDKVEAGEVMAVIESREMAESVADYLAAKRAEELARTTFNREKDLWTQKITAEQDYLSARNSHQEAQIRLDLTKQKLQALGLDLKAISSFDSKSSSESLRFHELKSPITGRVIGRELTLGEFVDTSHTAFTVADLSILWVEISVPSNDLQFIKEGQSANVISGNRTISCKVIFINPAIDSETRSTKAIIELDNKSGDWKAGEFVNVEIATSSQEAGIVIPKQAIQKIEGKDVVFVRTEDGFRPQIVVTGPDNNAQVEIISGLKAGNVIAASNTFILKAELGKSEAEHAH